MRFGVVELSSHGGLLQYGAQLSDGLASRGHDVHLIAPAGSEVVERLSTALLREILIEPVSPSQVGPTTFLGYQSRRILIAARLCLSLIRLVREVRSGYDVLILQDVEMLPYVLTVRLILHLNSGPRIALLVHNIVPFDRWGTTRVFANSRRIKRRLQRLYDSVDAVIVHGEFGGSQFREHWRAKRVIEVPHGNERIFTVGADLEGKPGHVLFFGAWRKVKGLSVLMDAFDLLTATHPEATLTIAGRPAPRDFDDRPLRSWAAVRLNVRLIDNYIPLDDVPDLVSSSQVMVMPYIAGFQSGVLHLAMSLGRPVVVTRVGEIGHVVEKYQCGIVVPPGSSVALAAALAEVMENKSRATAFGQAGYAASIDELSWDKIAYTIIAGLN